MSSNDGEESRAPLAQTIRQQREELDNKARDLEHQFKELRRICPHANATITRLPIGVHRWSEWLDCPDCGEERMLRRGVRYGGVDELDEPEDGST
jgi:hypothetical protein